MAGRLRTIRDLATVALAITLVGAVVVGAVGSERATAATTTTHRLTIPATAFQPTHDAFSYSSFNGALKGSGGFVAPVPFYRPGSKVQVRNLTMFVTDNDATLENDACISLYRSVAASGSAELMASTCTFDESPSVRAFQVAVPKPRNITQYEGAYLQLTIYGHTDDLLLHGVRITYRVTE